MIFKNRTEAGRQLATRLSPYAGQKGVIVLALPRGGVPVAFEVAKALHVSLDIFVVRKLGAPEQPELAVGAIAPGGVRVLNEDAVRFLRITDDQLDAITAKQRLILEEQEKTYRGKRSSLPLAGQVVILVDDGIATGSSIRAAVVALHQREPSRIIVAIPVATVSTCDELRTEADEVITVITPPRLAAVSEWYRNFSQVSDNEVQQCLQTAAEFAVDGRRLQQ